MFRRWFEWRGVTPLDIDRACGYIDRFVEIAFGSPIDPLDTRRVGRDEVFKRLCRVISLTEKRGYRTRPERRNAILVPICAALVEQAQNGPNPPSRRGLERHV